LRFETAQTRALRVEQSRNADHPSAVVEERQQLDCAREGAEQRFGDLFHGLDAGLFRVMKRPRR
jgi:hypothetical protein